MNNEDFADGLYQVARAAAIVESKRTGQRFEACDYTSGTDYKNNVFEMWAYWPHSECYTCEDHEWRAEETALLGAGWSKDESSNFGTKPYPEDYQERYAAALEKIQQEHDCPLVEWNFHHYASGLQVTWYKRIGRSTKSNNSMTATDWYTVVLDCLNSLHRDLEG